jgi:hypothetical protein
MKNKNSNSTLSEHYQNPKKKCRNIVGIWIPCVFNFRAKYVSFITVTCIVYTYLHYIKRGNGCFCFVFYCEARENEIFSAVGDRVCKYCHVKCYQPLIKCFKCWSKSNKNVDIKFSAHDPFLW